METQVEPFYMKGIEFFTEKKEYDGNSTGTNTPHNLFKKIIKDMKHILFRRKRRTSEYYDSYPVRVLNAENFEGIVKTLEDVLL